MPYIMMFLILILLIVLIISLYLYIYQVVKLLKLDKNKLIKYVALIVAIILIFGSIYVIFVSTFWSLVSLFILHLSLFSFITYLLNILLKRFKLWNKIYVFISLMLSFIVIVYGYFNMLNVVSTTYTVHNEKLDNQYKIVLIADLHYGVSLNDKQLKKYCDEISSLNPDFVVLAGDIVDERTTKKQMESAFKLLGSIKNNYGIFYTYGNHDKNNYSANPAYTSVELAKEIQKNNINILEEQIYLINEDLVIIGRGYDVRTSLDQILKYVDKEKFLLAVDHIPQEYIPNMESGINMLLSGHTHAGQIFPVGLIERIFKTSDLIYGISEYENFTGIVTSGIAGWAMPMRTEKHSEYVIINLEQ